MEGGLPDPGLSDQYIRAGCLLIHQTESGIAAEPWSSPYLQRWHRLVPRRLVHPDHDEQDAGLPILPSQVQRSLLSSRPVSSCRRLLDEHWIRLGFSVALDNPDQGILRVYLLPDDVGRRFIDRSDPALRRARMSLLARLDFSRSTWNGRVGPRRSPSPMPFRDGPAGDGGPADDSDPSLLHMFNNIPSPDPHPELISDPYSRDAAYGLLDGHVAGLETTLYPYQRRSAAFMLRKEAQPEKALDPRLVKVADQCGTPWYYDAVNGTSLVEPRYYDGVCGGILAEEMGSGKTLICLSLILATKDQPSRIPETYTPEVRRGPKVSALADMVAALITKNSVPWKLWLAPRPGEEDVGYANCVAVIRRNRAFYRMPRTPRRRPNRQTVAELPPMDVYVSYATLVIVPPNLVRQWRDEISKHTTGLKVLVCTSRQQPPPLGDLLECDIMLFSSTRFERLWRDGTSDGGGGDGDGGGALCAETSLNRVQFKRCIVDEGHRLGNSTGTSRSNMHLMLDSLHISARWVVTGTPSRGLFGVDDSRPGPSLQAPDGKSNGEKLGESSSAQEKDDLRRIGSIASLYLRARPWANTAAELCDTPADWSVYVMRPRHSTRSSGRKGCLKATLDSLIVRHRISEVAQLLPAIEARVVYLEGSYQDKLSLSIISAMVISNAVQSQRTGQDYFFHPRQRAALSQVVSNLRQASFFGGYFATQDALCETVRIAEEFMAEGKVPVSAEDETLLREAIGLCRLAAANSLKSHAALFREMPIYVKNFPGGRGKAWSLDQRDGDPVCMDPRMVKSLQKCLHPVVDAPNSLEMLFSSGKLELEGRLERSKALETRWSSHDTEATIAGNASLGHGANDLSHRPSHPHILEEMDSRRHPTEDRSERVVAASLSDTQIISTVSAKLSYLIDQVVKYHQEEQIIIFYEHENAAYYVAGMLEILQIEHLIYSRSGLSCDRRAQYVATFTHNPKFRVMLMDIGQAAFGLDMRSASRIYFINPVLNPQVEAQAIGRARRISQNKPVTVETLVLLGSIEEVIVKRRQEMTQAEQRRCKTILDDKPIYNWIRNARIMPLPGGQLDDWGQTAMLETPQFIFCRGFGRQVAHPDEDLVAMHNSPSGRRTAAHAVAQDTGSTTTGSGEGKRVRETIIAEGDDDDEEEEQEEEDKGGKTMASRRCRKRRRSCEVALARNAGSTSRRNSSSRTTALPPSRPPQRVRYGSDGG